MSSSVDIQIICSFCKQDLTEVDGVFCPSCGHTVFKNAVFNSKSKSTNSYDPLGIYTKPWKEKPLIKARVYPAAKEKAQPWYPTMRQPRRAKKPNKLQWKLAADSVPENASQNLEAKEGGEIQSDVPITSPESVPETETQASEVPKEPEIGKWCVLALSLQANQTCNQ